MREEKFFSHFRLDDLLLLRRMRGGSGDPNSPFPVWEGAAAYEAYFFSVSGVRCQMRSLYSLMVRSEEKMPDLATLMISLRVHALVSR